MRHDTPHCIRIVFSAIMPDLTSKGRPWHTFLRAFALCVLAVFGMLESPKFAMAIPAINESVFVLNAKNIVIDGAPVEPDVALRTNDAPPLIGSHVRGLAFQLSGFSTRISLMRRIEAVPRWKILMTQPSAMMGQVSCTM